MITPEQIAETLNNLGIDSPEKLVAFLRPAALSVAQRGAEAKVEAFEAETNRILAERETTRNELRAQALAEAAKFVDGAK